MPGKLLTASIVSMLIFFCSGNASGEWLLDTSIAFQYNDNVPNGSLDQDIKSDSALDFSLSPAFHSQLDGFTGITVGADLKATKQLDYSGLDEVSAGINAAVRKKFGLGLYAIWARISGSAGYHGFDDGQRDGWSCTLAIDAGKLVTDRLSIQAGYRFEGRRTDRSMDIPFLVSNFGIGGDAFDTDAHNFGITGMYQINERLSLLLGYTFRTGQITATTLRNTEIFDASDAIAVDPVFGPDRFAYRIDADTSIFSVGLSLALNYHSSVNVNYIYRDTNAYEDIAYSNNLVHVQLLYRF